MGQEDQATPRPWGLDRTASTENKLMIVTKNQLMHRCILMDGDFLKVKDAELIVKSVNSYDKNQETIKELVEVLKIVSDSYENIVIEEFGHGEARKNEELIKAKQAIQKAQDN